jgi:hypothetical protein
MHLTQVGSDSSKQVYPQPIGRKPDELPVHHPDEYPQDKPQSISQTPGSQSHLHEFEGSTKIAEPEEEPHNHRFAGVTSQVILVGDSHEHVVFTNTDFFEDHHHEVAAVSGPPVDVGDDKHVHFFKFITTLDDGHFHEFQFATLIQSPLTD